MAMGIKTTMGIDYDFIKTEEAKQIFIKLEKKRMLLEDYECGPNVKKKIYQRKKGISCEKRELARSMTSQQ